MVFCFVFFFKVIFSNRDYLNIVNFFDLLYMYIYIIISVLHQVQFVQRVEVYSSGEIYQGEI